MFDYLINNIINLGERIVKLEEEMVVMEKLLAERDRMMQVIPDALEWIAKRKLSCRTKTNQVQLVLNFDLRKESEGETICM